MDGKNIYCSLKLIPFVCPREEISHQTTKCTSNFDSGLCGTDASAFYNKIISTPSTHRSNTSKPSSQSEKIHKKPKQSSLDIADNKIKTHIFRFAQEGNINGIKECVDKGCSVNQQDAYGWTPLMCAVCEGHYTAVQYLLRCGADLNIKCNHGMTAAGIAKKSKNIKILKLLENGLKLPESSSSPDAEMEEKEKYCDKCNSAYKMLTVQHERSISHLLNERRSKASTFYHIPENNKGFQIMLKSGWDKNKGLGPNADGRKFPIKTVLKSDRSCIGKKKEVPKVTHFCANDVSSVKKNGLMNPIRRVREKTLKKWHQKKELEKSRRWEINFRRQFHSDF